MIKFFIVLLFTFHTPNLCFLQILVNPIAIFFCVTFLLLLIIFYQHFSFKKEKLSFFKQARTYFSQMMLQKIETEQRLERLEREHIEFVQQKNQAEEQCRISEIQTIKVTDSILYAKNIQTAILPPQSSVNQIIPENFIIYRPKDIVSGDYYWITKKGSKILLAAADCTGHGVPGALMSMLGIAFLSEIVNKHSSRANTLDIRANEILNQLNENIRHSLHQTGDEGEAKDGMDIALCILDLNKGVLEFSGAFSPIYIIKKTNNEKVGEEEEVEKNSRKIKIEHMKGCDLIQVTSDKMPIGSHYEKQSFTNYEIDIRHGDLIYMFSDGYVDQFGGDKGRKFSSRKFKQLLTEIHQKSMGEQKEILDQTIDDWRGNQEQVDDILVMGIRVTMKPEDVEIIEKYNWTDKRFLIAEDNEVQFRYLKEILAKTQANLVWAKNGQEALDIYQNDNQFDLLITDLHMPIMDGFELITQIKAINKDFPIIVQAAYKISNEKERSFSSGCNDYIAKPINPKEFLNIINRNLKMEAKI